MIRRLNAAVAAVAGALLVSCSSPASQPAEHQRFSVDMRFEFAGTPASPPEATAKGTADLKQQTADVAISMGGMHFVVKRRGATIGTDRGGASRTYARPLLPARLGGDAALPDPLNLLNLVVGASASTLECVRDLFQNCVHVIVTQQKGLLRVTYRHDSFGGGSGFTEIVTAQFTPL